MYAIAQHVPSCNQQTIAAKKVDDTGIGRRVPSRARVDLYAVSIARRTREQNQRRIQGQPATGTYDPTAPTKTTAGERCNSNLEPDRQYPPSDVWERRRNRKTLCRRQAFAS